MVTSSKKLPQALYFKISCSLLKLANYTAHGDDTHCVASFPGPLSPRTIFTSGSKVIRKNCMQRESRGGSRISKRGGHIVSRSYGGPLGTSNLWTSIIGTSNLHSSDLCTSNLWTSNVDASNLWISNLWTSIAKYLLVGKGVLRMHKAGIVLASALECACVNDQPPVIERAATADRGYPGSMSTHEHSGEEDADDTLSKELVAKWRRLTFTVTKSTRRIAGEKRSLEVHAHLWRHWNAW